MKVVVEITRYFDLNEARILKEPGFDPPSVNADKDEIRDWLKESFYELLSDFRTSDADHVDGKYVQLVDEDDYVDFQWPDADHA